MLRFLINLFKTRNKDKYKIKLADMDIEVDKKKGTMVITTNKHLTEEQVRELFEKYVLGED